MVVRALYCFLTASSGSVVGMADGSLHLTGVRVLAPHLTDENHAELFAAATHKSKRDVERVLAERFPKPAVPAEIRKLPERRPLLEAPAARPPTPMPTPARRSVVAPLSAAEYKIQFTARARLHEKFIRARDGLRHCVPNGDPAAIFERALDELLERIAREKRGAAKTPRPPRESDERSRLVPARVKREVYARDGEQCSFVGVDGRRCKEKGWLEIDHVGPFGKGGATITPNLRLLCRWSAHSTPSALIHPLRTPPVDHRRLGRLFEFSTPPWKTAVATPRFERDSLTAVSHSATA
jgi:hypothetical protein